MLNVDVRKGGRGLVKCGHLRTEGSGYEKGSFFADVLYGRPLRPEGRGFESRSVHVLYFRKEFLHKTIFTLFILSRASDNSTSLNI